MGCASDFVPIARVVEMFMKCLLCWARQFRNTKIIIQRHAMECNQLNTLRDLISYDQVKLSRFQTLEINILNTVEKSTPQISRHSGG